MVIHMCKTRCSTLVVPCVVNPAQKPAMSNADLEWSGESLDAKALAVVATSALGQLKEKITSTNGTNGPGGVVNNGRCVRCEVELVCIIHERKNEKWRVRFENWRVRTYFVAEVVPEKILPPLTQSSSGGAPDADVASGNGTQETSVPGRRVTQHWWQLFAPKPVVRKGGLPSNHASPPTNTLSLYLPAPVTPPMLVRASATTIIEHTTCGFFRTAAGTRRPGKMRAASTGQTTPEADENSSRDVRSAEL
ncbi:hypothetical protein H4582DRAFT_2132689 [Lactarius indigo]|nr:hypothetical protein H4582DRAFT_2132689 [Lactarius indigo]